uniref:hypothetical protein n=1 Tax=Candidatus Enterovibrio altilux TaxID=1927128 RepID=UPI001237B24C|nr:hypothetical protein [Candidatus Enterovibrio luxaltus]
MKCYLACLNRLIENQPIALTTPDNLTHLTKKFENEIIRVILLLVTSSYTVQISSVKRSMVTINTPLSKTSRIRIKKLLGGTSSLRNHNTQLN